MRLLNKAALITEANNPHGIWAEVARARAAEGAMVGLTYRRIGEPQEQEPASFGSEFYVAQGAKLADELTRSIKEGGGTAHLLEVDLVSPERRDFDLVRNNQAALEACRDAAAKSKREQRCGVTVPVQ